MSNSGTTTLERGLGLDRAFGPALDEGSAAETSTAPEPRQRFQNFWVEETGSAISLYIPMESWEIEIYGDQSRAAAAEAAAKLEKAADLGEVAVRFTHYDERATGQQQVGFTD